MIYINKSCNISLEDIKNSKWINEFNKVGSSIYIGNNIRYMKVDENKWLRIIDHIINPRVLMYYDDKEIFDICNNSNSAQLCEDW